MATPSLSQARSLYEAQRLRVVGAVRQVRRLFAANRPLAEVVAVVAAHQQAAAATSTSAIAAMAGASRPLTQASAFRGVTAAGFPLSELLVATIDSVVPAPVEPLPANWWDDAREFMANLEQVIASEVRDAARSAAQVEIVVRPDWQNYVRMLQPPSCARCAILAGRIYRDLEAFQRHPQCDCVQVPVQNWEEAHDAGYVSSPEDAFEKGHIRGLSKADEQAIRDGASIGKVVNAHRGMYTTELFGRRVQATRASTTKRAAWRKANPTRLVRLRPEAIYRIAEGDTAEAVRLLRLYGYLTS